MNDSVKQQQIKPDWLGKTIIGVVFGLALSFGLVGIFSWLGADSLNQPLSDERLLWRTQFSMWMITPIWLLIFSFVYMFGSAKRATLWLGGANVFVFIALIIIRGMA